jgi:signal transduction histidine kinase
MRDGRWHGGPGWRYSRARWQHNPARWQHSRQWRRPTAGSAIVAAAFQILGCRFTADRPLTGREYALLLAGPVALLVLRRAPTVAFAVAAAATVTYYVLDNPGGPAFVAAFVALLGAVRGGNRIAARVIMLLAYVAYLSAGWLVPDVADPVPLARALAVGAWMLVAYGFAEAARVRAGQLAALARARAEEERARAEQARAEVEQRRRQASEERLRIARELHDVLGHHLSLINVQAGVGLHLMDERPDQAREALTAIKQASSEALREVRAVLSALRPQGEAPPRTPTPGLADVADLAASAGLPVALTVEGSPRDVPPDVDRAAYRIAQEALTNVRRHAGDGATAELTVLYRPDCLRLSIVDDGTGAGPIGDNGSGIAGMRERAAALGGTVRTGRRPEGGFEVVADLPLRSNR